MNILIFIILIGFSYFCINFLYKKYSFKGLYCFSIINIILLNFIYLKQINIYNIMINMDIFIIINLFIINNIILQNKGKKESKRYALEMIYVLSISYIVLALSSYLDSANVIELNNNYFKSIFYLNIKSFLAICFSFIIGVLINNKIYFYFRVEKNKIWISNIISIIISQFFASLIFIVIMYSEIYNFQELVITIIIRLLLLCIISIIFTRLIYNTQKLGGKNENKKNRLNKR